MMKLKLFVITLMIAFGLGGEAIAQANMKIGYLNLDLALLYMPETKSMNQQLATFQKKLGEQLKVKEEYAQQRLMEYYQGKESGKAEADLKKMEDELTGLDGEIRKFAADSEEKLMKKQQSLMEPIIAKLETAIQDVAKEGGYTYIFNTTDGNGVSIILHAPDEHNVTRLVMKKLGIEIPNE
jgi:outer membrane protein